MPMNAPKRTVPGGASVRQQSLGYLVRYAHRAFVKALARELAPHAILSAQWSVLRVLWNVDGLSQVDLAERMQVEKASLTGVLEGLARKGLIKRERNRQDRRKITISLTAKGAALKGGLLPYGEAINVRASKGMTKAETGALKDALATLIANLAV